MIACAAAICLFQLASLVPGEMDFKIVDLDTSEMLVVQWISPTVTKNTDGDACWLFDGATSTPCI